MRKESRVINYIPRQFQERLSALFAIDYSLRAFEETFVEDP